MLLIPGHAEAGLPLWCVCGCAGAVPLPQGSDRHCNKAVLACRAALPECSVEQGSACSPSWDSLAALLGVLCSSGTELQGFAVWEQMEHLAAYNGPSRIYSSATFRFLIQVEAENWTSHTEVFIRIWSLNLKFFWKQGQLLKIGFNWNTRLIKYIHRSRFPLLHYTGRLRLNFYFFDSYIWK